MGNRGSAAVRVALGVLVSSVGVVASTTPDNMTFVVPAGTTGGAAVGGYAYDAAGDAFFVGRFSQNDIIRYDVATQATDTTYCTNSDLNRFYRSTDVPGGVTAQTTTGSAFPAAFLLNPAPLTIDFGAGVGTVHYPAGTLMFIIDQQSASNEVKIGGVNQPQHTKKIYRYDLRKIGAPTAVQPDRANAQDGAGGIMGAFGQTDWNDALSVLLMKDQILAVTGAPATQAVNLGRQFAFSSDGQFIYYTDTNTTSPNPNGGVYKVSASTGALVRVFSEGLGSGNTPICEPSVVPTSARDFTGGTGTGDQVLINGYSTDGSQPGGNEGGLNYLLDTGSYPLQAGAALTAARINTVAQYNGRFNPRTGPCGAPDPDPGAHLARTPDIMSTCTAPDGTIYYYDAAVQSVWRWDPQDRLVCISSRNQRIRFNLSQNSSSTQTSALRLQLRAVEYTGDGGSFVVPQLMFQHTARQTVGAIFDFKTGDFDRDDVVDGADLALFFAAMARPIRTFCTSVNPSGYYEAPAADDDTELEVADEPAFVDYLKFDLNNNGLATPRDRFILWQFAYPGQSPVDFDLDGDADMDDFAHLQACWSGDGVSQSDPLCQDARLDEDADVDAQDLEVFIHCASGPAVPADPACVF